jgi:phosphate transport system protein
MNNKSDGQSGKVMERHYIQELEALKANIIRMGSMVEQAVADSIRAMLERNPEIARRVLDNEQQINAFELKNDAAIVDLLALQQPVARDLRFILAALKINNDLERIGDHAVNLAESAVTYSSKPPLNIQIDIPHMAQIAQAMLHDAIDGFVHTNAASCRGVLQNDDLADALNRKTVDDLIALIQRDPSSVHQALELVRVSRNLERVADLATNIAEEVIFEAEAAVVKHLADQKREPQ